MQVVLRSRLRPTDPMAPEAPPDSKGYLPVGTSMRRFDHEDLWAWGSGLRHRGWEQRHDRTFPPFIPQARARFGAARSGAQASFMNIFCTVSRGYPSLSASSGLARQ
jgi:hypothetical protein